MIGMEILTALGPNGHLAYWTVVLLQQLYSGLGRLQSGRRIQHDCSCFSASYNSTGCIPVIYPGSPARKGSEEADDEKETTADRGQETAKGLSAPVSEKKEAPLKAPIIPVALAIRCHLCTTPLHTWYTWALGDDGQGGRKTVLWIC